MRIITIFKVFLITKSETQRKMLNSANIFVITESALPRQDVLLKGKNHELNCTVL